MWINYKMTFFFWGTACQGDQIKNKGNTVVAMYKYGLSSILLLLPRPDDLSDSPAVAWLKKKGWPCFFRPVGDRNTRSTAYKKRMEFWSMVVGLLLCLGWCLTDFTSCNFIANQGPNEDIWRPPPPKKMMGALPPTEDAAKLQIQGVANNGSRYSGMFEAF